MVMNLSPFYDLSLPNVISPTTAAEGLRYVKAVRETLLIAPMATPAAGATDLTASAGSAWSYEVSRRYGNTGANQNAVVGVRYSLNFIFPTGVTSSENLIDWDYFFAMEAQLVDNVAVANSVKYLKVGEDTAHGAIASKGFSVSFANMAASLEVYTDAKYTTAANWSMTANRPALLTLIHIPTVGEYLYVDDVQKAADTTHLLSGDAAGATYAIASMANGATATDHYFKMGDLKIWVPRIQ